MEWRIFPLDVLFFRGLEPMNAGEAAVVRPQFPPSPEVTQGFVRTALLDALGVAVEDYAAAVQGRASDPAAQEAMALLGRPDDLGRLDLRGPYLIRQQGASVERWYPAPLNLRQQSDGVWRAAAPGSALDSDLGAVAFLPAPGEGERPAPTGMWIAEGGLAAYLRGDPLAASQVRAAEDFSVEEQRAGIGRDALTRATSQGMLYAPAFVRLHDGDDRGARVGIGLRVDGIDPDLQRRCAGVHRLGGEGRLVAVEVHVGQPPPVTFSGNEGRLVLLTPARWGGRWLPPGFVQAGGRWSGGLEGKPMVVVSAAIGKPVWIGGWDLVRRGPKAAEACAPAGSVYFVRAEDGADLSALHDQKLGLRGRAGFGHIVTGRFA